MTDLRRTGRAAVAALLAGLVLACCSDAPSTSSRPDTPASSATPRSEAPSGAPSSEESAEPVELPWPASGAADAAALQAAVDNGSQPWLLDPSEVAISYASTAHGWIDTEAYPGPDGTSVDVRNSDGDRLTLTLAQPGRTGDDGIWVVTAERPS